MINNFIRQRIHENYEELSPAERRVGDYLLAFEGEELPPSGQIARELFVSEAALTRFAKSCGFHGFRELRYVLVNTETEQDVPAAGPEISRLVSAYQLLFERTFSSIDEEQIRRTAQKAGAADKILVCGIGHSGLAAREYAMRLMRIGLRVEVADEGHMLRIMASLLTENSLLIALSVSGTTREIVKALKIARSKGAAAVLITAAEDPEGAVYCDEIIHTGRIRNLESGITVSPQLPLLTVFDLLYGQLLALNHSAAMTAHSATLSALGVRQSSGASKHKKKKGS